MTTIRFTYTNHHGKVAERTVDVDSLEYYNSPGFGYEPGWFISGFCHDKQARRSFALEHISINGKDFKQGIYRLAVFPQDEKPKHPYDTDENIGSIT